MAKRSWGFDVRDLNPRIRPQDDFYRYAAGGWMKRNPIPATESWWGSFSVLRYQVEKQLHAIIKELESKRTLPKGSPEKLMRDFFRSGMDMKRRNAVKLRPLASWIRKIENVQTFDDLQEVVASLHRVGVGVFFGAGVDQDSKESAKYVIHIYQDGLGMPDRDYYLKDDANSRRIRKAYTNHVENIFKLAGRSALEAKQSVLTVMKIETAFARASMPKEELRDADKTYHKKTLKQLKTLSPAINWKRYFIAVGAKQPTSVIVMQPAFLKALSSLLTRTPLEELKTYLYWHLLNDFAAHLSLAFVKENFAFYAIALRGAKKMKPLWRQTLMTVNGLLGELLGRIYVKRHFTPKAKRKMNSLIDDLFVAYEARIKNLDWMSPATKKKALKKLRSMNRKIGYPNKWKSYAGLRIDPSDYVGNVLRASEYEHLREMRKLGKPIDRDEWFMTPQSVNAYFAPNLNDIAFPAAILQPPFFDMEADDAINYGSIGSVIGHEITHGFDDQGSKYDEHGNLKSWWTPADRKRFDKKTALIVKQYDGYTVAPGVHVNGKLTLGENVADLGGISIAFDAYQLHLAKTGRTTIEGYTPEQRFFLGVTLFDRSNARSKFLKMQVKTDRHSPDEFRITGTLANINAFYDAFNVGPNDKLYRKPSIRTTVW